MREVDPREKNKQEPLNKELSWAFLLSLSSFPSSATCHLNHYSWNCKNRHSPIHFRLPKEAVNRPTNFSLNALSSVTALFSHSYTLLHLLRLHPHHSLVWGRKDAAGKKITRHTSGPSTSLGVTIDYVHWARPSEHLLISLPKALMDRDPPLRSPLTLPSSTCVIILCWTNRAIPQVW